MKKPNRNLFSEFNPISAIDGNVIKNKTNDVAVVFKLNMPEIFTMGKPEFDKIHSDFLKMFNVFQAPENLVIHKKDIFLKKMYNVSNLKDETFLQKTTKSSFTDRYYVDHTCFFSFILPGLPSLKRNYNKVSILKKIDNTPVIKEIEDFVSNVRQAVSILNSSDLVELKPATDDEIIENLIGEFTLFENEVGDLSFEPEFKIGENYVSIFSISDDGQQDTDTFSNCIIDRNKSTDISEFVRSTPYPMGLELNTNHVYNQYIFLDNQQKVKTDIELNKRRLSSSRLLGRRNAVAASRNEMFLNSAESDNIKITRLHTNLMVWTKSKDQLDNIKDRVSGAFSLMDITPNINSKYEYPYIYLANLLGNGGMIPEEETFYTYLNHAICHFLIETNYKSDPAGLLFNDRLNNCPIYVDVFDEPYANKEIVNRNYIIVAPSGGGKSFLMRHKIRQQIENPINRTVVLNIGGDDKMARAYPDDSLYIEYDENKPLELNPFWIWENRITTSKIEFLIEFNALLWKGGKEITNDERSSLEKIILDFYGIEESMVFVGQDDIGERSFIVTKTEHRSLPDFFKYLGENRDRLYTLTKDLINIDSLTVNLEKYVKGTYDNLFVSGEPKRFEDKKYVEFELDKIKDHQILFPIFSSVITDLVFNTMWKRDGTQKDFVADEAWVYLEKPGMGQIFKYLYKTIRKFDGSVGMAVQQITDLGVLSDTDEKAILGNIAIKYLLDHRDAMDSVSILQEKLSLSHADKSMLLSIQNKKKREFKGDSLYTEFLLKMGSKLSRVLRLETSKECAVLYESDKNKLGVFDEIYYHQANKNFELTIEKFLNN